MLHDDDVMKSVPHVPADPAVGQPCIGWLAAMQAAMQVAAVVSILTECIFSNRWLNQQPTCNSIDLWLPVRTLLCPLHTCFAVQALVTYTA